MTEFEKKRLRQSVSQLCADDLAFFEQRGVDPEQLISAAQAELEGDATAMARVVDPLKAVALRQRAASRMHLQAVL